MTGIRHQHCDGCDRVGSVAFLDLVNHADWCLGDDLVDRDCRCPAYVPKLEDRVVDFDDEGLRRVTFRFDGLPLTRPKPMPSANWRGIWDLSQRVGERLFTLPSHRGGARKNHLLRTRPGQGHRERVRTIREAYGQQVGRVTFDGVPVILIVEGVYNAPSPVSETRGRLKPTTPDADNLLKMMGDALTDEVVDKVRRGLKGTAWADDKVVAAAVGFTRFATSRADRPHTAVVIMEAGPQWRRQLAREILRNATVQ